MEIKAGDWVRTSRFLNVRIEAVFLTEADARIAGYTEPTHYVDEEYTVLGKGLGQNLMVFAAAHKQTH